MSKSYWRFDWVYWRPGTQLRGFESDFFFRFKLNWIFHFFLPKNKSYQIFDPLFVKNWIVSEFWFFFSKNESDFFLKKICRKMQKILENSEKNWIGFFFSQIESEFIGILIFFQKTNRIEKKTNRIFFKKRIVSGGKTNRIFLKKKRIGFFLKIFENPIRFESEFLNWGPAGVRRWKGRVLN